MSVTHMEGMAHATHYPDKTNAPKTTHFTIRTACFTLNRTSVARMRRSINASATRARMTSMACTRACAAFADASSK